MFRRARLLMVLRPFVLMVVTLLGCSSHLGGESVGSEEESLNFPLPRAFPGARPTCPSFDESVFPTAETPRVRAAAVGTIPGAFAVSHAGAATYSMQVAIPPGRAGVQPAISIAYNSDSGNGLVGMGFSIAGLSTIHRCGGNNVDDGARSEVRYDRGDNFCLDGARLGLVAGT